MLTKDDIINVCQTVISGLYPGFSRDRGHQSAEPFTDWLHHESRHYRVARRKVYKRFASTDEAIAGFVKR